MRRERERKKRKKRQQRERERDEPSEGKKYKSFACKKLQSSRIKYEVTVNKSKRQEKLVKKKKG